MLSTFTTQFNIPYPVDLTEYDNIISDASWGGQTLFTRTHFIDFPSNTAFCGGRLSLFSVHHNHSDYVPESNFEVTTFDNVNLNALGYFSDSLPEWAVVE